MVKFHQAELDINVGGFSVEFQRKPGENAIEILEEKPGKHHSENNMLHNLSLN